MPSLPEHRPRPRTRGTDDGCRPARARRRSGADDRAWTVSPHGGPSPPRTTRRVRRRDPRPSDRREAERRIRHDVTDHLGPAPDALVAERRDGPLVRAEEQGCEPVDLDPRALLRHREVAAAEARLDMGDRTPPRSRRGRPQASSWCRRARPRRRAARRRRPREGVASACRRRESAGRAGTPARRSRARRRTPRRARRPSAGPVWTTTSASPAARSASESGAALTNCGRLPTTVKDLMQSSVEGGSSGSRGSPTSVGDDRQDLHGLPA